jgi:hypothetical protein
VQQQAAPIVLGFNLLHDLNRANKSRKPTACVPNGKRQQQGRLRRRQTGIQLQSIEQQIPQLWQRRRHQPIDGQCSQHTIVAQQDSERPSAWLVKVWHHPREMPFGQRGVWGRGRTQSRETNIAETIVAHVEMLQGRKALVYQRENETTQNAQ